MIILDTDAVTFLEHREGNVSRQLRSKLHMLSAEDDVVSTVVTFEEQTRGWLSVFARASDPISIIRAYDKLLSHANAFREIELIAYTQAAHTKFAELSALKIRIGTRDLRIAAIALSHDAILYSRNLKDFQQVPNLRVVDWTKAP